MTLPVYLTFHGDLSRFLRRRFVGTGSGGMVERTLTGKTAVKDVIEACGVPHPEVDLIVVTVANKGRRALVFTDPVDPLNGPASLDVFPVPAPEDMLPGAPRLQLPRRQNRFVLDGHLGTLARNLWLLGVDARYGRALDDDQLADLAAREDRALLTRDRGLLMRAAVGPGYCLRSGEGEAQTGEVLRRFDPPLVPFTRCLRCGAPTAVVAKAEVASALADEPLTRQFYEDFRRCPGCGQIYWPGSHHGKLIARVGRLLGMRRESPSDNG